MNAPLEDVPLHIEMLVLSSGTDWLMVPQALYQVQPLGHLYYSCLYRGLTLGCFLVPVNARWPRVILSMTIKHLCPSQLFFGNNM